MGQARFTNNFIEGMADRAWVQRVAIRVSKHKVVVGLAFIDPHGLRYAQGGFNDPKLQLHNDLKALASALQPHCPDWKVILTSFIISTSPYDKIAKAFGEGKHTIQDFEENHVLFSDDPYYVGKLLNSMTKCK